MPRDARRADRLASGRDEVAIAGDRLLRTDAVGSRALVLLGPRDAGVRRRVDEVAARWQHPHPPIVVVGRPADLLDPRRIVEALASGLPGPPSSGFVGRVARTVADHPLLLVLAEAHWADPAVLEELAGALEVRGAAPVSLLLGGVPTRALTGWAERLAAAGLAEAFAVEPAAGDGVAALLADRVGSDVAQRVAAVVAEVTAGWLGTVEEIAAQLAANRLVPGAQLPSDLELLLGVVVLGEPARRSLVEQVTGLERPDAVASVDRLLGIGVLDEVTPGYVALATSDASAVRAAATPGVLSQLHRRAFSALLDVGDIARAARHGLEGDMMGVPEAVAAATGEAEHALGRGAIEDAVVWSAGALRLAGGAATARDLGLHGDALLAAGRPTLAADVYRSAIGAVGGHGSTEAVDLRRRQARALAYAGELAASTEASLDAWARSADAPGLRADIAIDHLHALLQQAGPAGAIPQLAAYEATGDLPMVPMVEVAARFIRLYAGGTGDDADRLVEVATLAHDPTRSSPFDPILCATAAARFAERWELDEPLLRAEIARSAAAGRSHAHAAQSISLADSLIRQGRPREALALLDDLDRRPFLLLAEAVDLTAAAALVEQGRAEDLAARLEVLPTGGRMWATELWVRHQRAALDLFRGDVDAASRRYVALAEACTTAGVGLPEGIPWAEHAIDAHAAAGALGAVEELCRWLEVSALGSGSWRFVVAHRGRAALAEAAGDLDGAESWLEAGAAPRGGRRLVRARLLLRWAEVRRALGRRADALPLYREALATFDAAGAETDAARCVAGIRAVGGRRAAGVAAAVNGLTPQEHRVATLAAAGRLTREIAADLFISARTVETHLRHIYEKLGVRSKADLLGIDIEAGVDPADGRKHP